MHSTQWRHSTRAFASFYGASSTATATSTSWTPANVTTAFWYDATDNATVLKAGLTAASNGDGVVQWNDKSGNSRNLTQATTSSQPLYNTNAMNSLAGLTFNAVTNYLVTSTFSQAQPFLIMAVVKAPTNFYSVFVSDHSGSDPKPIILARNEVSPSEAICIQDDGAARINTGVTVKSTGCAFYGLFNAPGTSRGRVTTGSEVTSTGLSSQGFANGVIIGSSEVGTSSINGQVCEVFCITGTSTIDKDNAMDYVATKWGVGW